MRFKTRIAPSLLLWLEAAFVLWWFRYYFSATPLPAVDLPAHVRLIEAFKQHWLKGDFSFYDHTSFTGWAPFVFDGWIPALITTLASYPISLFSNETVLVACHILMVFGLAFLPFLMRWTIEPLFLELKSFNTAEEEKLRWLLNLSIVTFSFWFINHDHQWHGIGGAGITNIGLYNQLFGWYFLLWYLGALWRQLGKQEQHTKSVAFSFGGLYLSHNMTFVFACYIFIMVLLWYPNRWRIFKAHLLGFGLTMFWSLPAIYYLSDFSAYDPYRPVGDFLTLFLRYPIFELIQAVISAIHGQFSLINPTYILMCVLLATFLTSEKVRQTKLLFPFFLFSILGVIFFSSDYVGASLPFPIHYYRFLGYLFLLLTLLIIPLPLVLQYLTRGPALVCSLLVVCFVCTIFMPHSERKMIQQRNTPQYLWNEETVLDYFKLQPNKGRVFFEYLTDYKFFPPLSAHYMESKLYSRTGFESANDCFIQRTLAYRMLVASAKLLSADTYNVPLLFTDHAQLDDATKISQLREFGITHLVIGTKTFFERVKSFALEEPKKIGRYWVVKLQDPPAAITPLSKTPIGYVDNNGSLPFEFMQFYFYTRGKLSNNYELISLSNAKTIPEQIKTIIVNGSNSDRKTEGKEIVSLDYRYNPVINHFSKTLQTNLELVKFVLSERYLDKTLKLAASPLPVLPSTEKNEFAWSNDGQTMHLSGLKSGGLYRINYSYFPYWRSADGAVLRGSQERIFFLGNGDHALLAFAKYRAPVTWIGLILSLLSIFLVFRPQTSSK